MSTMPLPSSDSDNEVYGSLQPQNNNNDIIDLTLNPSSDSETSTVVTEEINSNIDSEDGGPGEIQSDNDSEEEKKENEIQEEKKEEEFTCGVCYIQLNLTNSVRTMCNHNFCNTCFFRWIEVNTQCPMCRSPVDSKTNLTDEQMRRELSDVYSQYTGLLIDNTTLFQQHKRVCDDLLEKYKEASNLKNSCDGMLQRQIRLREQIELTRGYNEGQLAAIHNLSIQNKNDKNEYTSIILNSMKDRPSFMKGFYKGLHEENRSLNLFKKGMVEKVQNLYQKSFIEEQEECC